MNKTMKLQQSKSKKLETHYFSRWLKRIGMGSLALFTILIAIISALPLVLLFFVTAVPTWISSLLVLLNLGIIAMLFWLKTTPLSLSGACLALIFVAILAVVASQRFASTPPIADEFGNVVPGSIASLETVELGGREQWITIRGHSTDLPVLLFLAGGPGGSELAMTRRYLSELEEHFIVVNWDQPGTGKSYLAADFDTITPEQYVADAYELTQYLRQRFNQEKIYVFGESWGSIPGIWLVQEHPELFHAFVSTGQMVDVVENDTVMYEFAIELAGEQGRVDDIERLRQIGPPPYPPETLLGNFNASNVVINDYMHGHAHGEGTGHNLLFDSMAAPEYGLLDKAYWAIGLYRTFTTVYPQLYDLDFRTQVTDLDLPVYFIHGRWDMNAIGTLAEGYFDILNAPHKEFIWFENSAHTPSWDEPQHFVDVMVNTVLADTLPPEPDFTTFEGYFDTQIPVYLNEYNIAGAVVSVVQNNEPVHLAAYGFSNLEEQIPMNAETSVLNIGSAGKLFTATAIMQLVEQGQIDLNADVNTYLDFEIPDTYPEPITVWHLLTHTSGFEEHNFGLFPSDPTQLLPIRNYLIRNLPARRYPPGETVGYSNYGMTLAGYIVERVSGMTLSEYLENNVINALGMSHSNADRVPDIQNPNLAIGYNNLRPQPIEYVAAFGADPIHATAADMTNFMMAYLDAGRWGDTQLLQAETITTMQSRQYTAHPDVNGTGLGFYEMSRNGQRIVGHLGTTNNFHTLLLLFPEHDLGIFVSFNSAEGGQVLRSPRFMNDLMDQFFPQTVNAITPPSDFGQRADEYSGTYFWNNRFGHNTLEKFVFLMDTVTIRSTDDNRLHVRMGGHGITFTEIGSDTFIQNGGDDLLIFHRDEAGQITGASLSSRAVFTLERQFWYENPSLTLVVLSVSTLIFIISLVVSGISLWSRPNHAISTISVLSQGSAVALPLLNLLFLVGFAMLLPELMRGGFPEITLRLVLGLPIIALVLTVILGGTTTLMWIRNDASLLIRFQYSVLVITGTLFALTLNVWNLLGWRLY